MTHEEFVDLCILCGCDYTHSIGGIGPGTAFKLISECKTIENVLEKIEETCKIVPTMMAPSPLLNPQNTHNTSKTS